jgi:Transcriptional regulators
MIQDLKLEVNEQISLTDVVFENLCWAILKGDLLPGERLREVPLANQFNASRTYVRKAIRKLELEGLAFLMSKCGAQLLHIRR